MGGSPASAPAGSVPASQEGFSVIQIVLRYNRNLLRLADDRTGVV
jgi:hypothetical protein